ncbi:hypothetical protein QJS64_19965 (plasmid) [Paraclostridium bifermentans]|uniref:Uncharacterized protein n=1 Tax=Paraclostridium bifermentans TaxID=1490 RepID=A0ABY8R9J5_PARBF|nr:hypothetical protein QJS64_19965 [Paraclostridium bifermentans]
MFSYILAIFNNLPSSNLDPTKVIPIGSPLLLYPAGTVRAG